MPIPSALFLCPNWHFRKLYGSFKVNKTHLLNVFHFHSDAPIGFFSSQSSPWTVGSYGTKTGQKSKKEHSLLANWRVPRPQQSPEQGPLFLHSDNLRHRRCATTPGMQQSGAQLSCRTTASDTGFWWLPPFEVGCRSCRIGFLGRLWFADFCRAQTSPMQRIPGSWIYIMVHLQQL